MTELPEKSLKKEKFILDIPESLIKEALNIPEDKPLKGLEEIYSILVIQQKINPWLQAIKDGNRSTSRVASGVLPEIVRKYQVEKQKLIPLVEEIGLLPKDYQKLTPEEKYEAKDHNELRKKIIVKILKEQSLIPKEFSNVSADKLINAIIDSGGLQAFAKKFDLKIPRAAKDLATNLVRTIIKKREPNKVETISGRKKFSYRRKRATKSIKTSKSKSRGR